ncbi:amidase [Nocardia sp. NBC_00403]|uniref:amidase n=1 Tax=Nocardia sp. NBC_00403 TaxID=2975990 RepID=UPI002E22EC07
MQLRLSRRSFVRSASIGAGVAATGLTNAVVAAAPPIARRAPGLPDAASIAATDPAMLSAVEAASLLQARELHPVELLDACIERSSAFDGAIGAWVRTYPELAHEQAERAADRLSAGNAPLICGLPIAVKDLYAVAGLPLTASSRILDGNIAAGDSTVWRRLHDNGAVLMGHVHNDEFAIMTDTLQVGNPWNIDESVGGSSGGSAAALAARFAPLSIGTDTGGSLRIPASRCGVSAIKPTFGRCSKYGIIPVVWTRDHPGPLGRSIADASLLLSYMTGADAFDPVTAIAPPVPDGGFPIAAVGGDKPLAGKRLGVPRGVTEMLPDALATLFARFLDLFTVLGGETRDVTMPAEPEGLLSKDAVEVGLYHRQWADRLPSYQPPTAAIVGLGLAALAAPAVDWWQLARARASYQRDYNRMLEDSGLDAVVLPGAITDGLPRSAAAAVSILGASTVPFAWANYTGVPVLSLPVERSAVTGLPFGVQLGGRPWAEAELISIGLELQAAAPVWRDIPPLSPNARALPEVSVRAPGPGPDPTNTGAAAPSFSFVPTTSTAPI